MRIGVRVAPAGMSVRRLKKHKRRGYAYSLIRCVVKDPLCQPVPALSWWPRLSPMPYLRSRRKLFITTVTLESAMAAEASIGDSSPTAATGIARVL